MPTQPQIRVFPLQKCDLKVRLAADGGEEGVELSHGSPQGLTPRTQRQRQEAGAWDHCENTLRSTLPGQDLCTCHSLHVATCPVPLFIQDSTEVSAPQRALSHPWDLDGTFCHSPSFDPALFFSWKAFLLLCLPLSLCQTLGMAPDSLQWQDLKAKSLIVFSIVWASFIFTRGRFIHLTSHI